MSRRGALPRRILIPLVNPRTAADLVRIGGALLDHGGVLTALSIVEVAEGQPLSEGATRARQARRLLQRVLEFAPPGVDVRTVVRIGRRASEGVIELATEEESDLIIFGWGGRTQRPARRAAENVFSPTIDEVVRDAPCDIAVIKQRGISEVRRILAPVRGGPHAELALGFADALGRAFHADVDVLHVVPPDLDPTVRSQAERALATSSASTAASTSSRCSWTGPTSRSRSCGGGDRPTCVVMGATAGHPDARRARTARSSGCCRRPSPAGAVDGRSWSRRASRPRASEFEERAAQSETLEAAERAAEAGRSAAARVDRWFGESSFHHAEFADLRPPRGAQGGARG